MRLPGSRIYNIYGICRVPEKGPIWCPQSVPLPPVKVNWVCGANFDSKVSYNMQFFCVSIIVILGTVYKLENGKSGV